MIKPYSEEHAEALRFLIRHLIELRGTTQEKFAKSMGMSRGQLNRYIKNRDLKRDGEKKLYEALAQQLLTSLQETEEPELPSFMRSVAAATFEEEAVAAMCRSDVPARPRRGIIDDPAVLAYRSRYFQHDDHEAMRSVQYGKITGLSVLIRPSNESVQDSEERGISASILNLPPEHIETGDYHPVFKLRQKSANGTPIDFEGTVLAQDDRFVLEGREVQTRRAILLSFSYNAADGERYRASNAGKGSRAGFNGVMMGANNHKSHFVAPFRIYAIPGSYLSPDESNKKSALEEFWGIYERSRDVAGVFSRQRLEERLGDMGIDNCMEDIDSMLARAKRQSVFSAA